MPLTVYRPKGSEVWHYKGTVAGRRLRRSARTKDKAVAQRLAAEAEDRLWKGHFDGPGAVLTFAQAAMQYRLAEKPTRYLQKIEDYWKDTAVKDITRGAIRQSAIVLYPNAKAATRNRQVIVPTMAIINHAAELELCPPIRVKRFPVEMKEREPATWEWVKAFMGAGSARIGALACFMFLTGARVSEAISVRWGDLELSRRRALIRQTKIGAERWAHLPPVLVAAIANIGERSPYNSKPENDRVFGYVSKETAKFAWRAAIAKAGIRPLTYHACRHGFATALLHKGIDPVTVAKRGGWKNPAQVFATYGHPSDDETVADRIVGEIGKPVAGGDIGIPIPVRKQRLTR